MFKCIPQDSLQKQDRKHANNPHDKIHKYEGTDSSEYKDGSYHLYKFSPKDNQDEKVI